MKIGLVYTSTTPELIEQLENEVKMQLGSDMELLSYEDASILADVRESNYVTSQAATRLLLLYLKAVQDGAEVILNVCSSVGEVADCAQDMADYIGVPIVRIDEDMCKDAVRNGCRIGVLATLSSTLEPTKHTLMRVARILGKQITLVDGLIDSAFGLDQAQFKERLLHKVEELIGEVDVILLCQGSMAYCESLIHDTYHIPVLSSPRYGAIALKNALIEKGLLKEEVLPC
ncbi:MAG: aspartate/glutamate racemase family protein [Lachnospiraceae bacterium]